MHVPWRLALHNIAGILYIEVAYISLLIHLLLVVDVAGQLHLVAALSDILTLPGGALATSSLFTI